MRNGDVGLTVRVQQAWRAHMVAGSMWSVAGALGWDHSQQSFRVGHTPGGSKQSKKGLGHTDVTAPYCANSVCKSSSTAV